MITKNNIVDAYLLMLMRRETPSIPSETLEFMKDVALRELEIIESGRTCFSCKHDGGQQVFKSGCTGCGGHGEYRNFRLKN